MDIVEIGLGLVLAVASLVCCVIILVEMFRDEIWKGIVGILCGLYFLYYALFEFEHDHKWLIVVVAVFSGGFFTLLRAN